MRISRADALFEFLGRYEPDRLYLVGDIIDGWKLRRTFRWDNTASFVIRRMLGMLKRGTRVFYVVGSRDAFLRPWCPQLLGGVELAHKLVYVTLDGNTVENLGRLRLRNEAHFTAQSKPVDQMVGKTVFHTVDHRWLPESG